MYQTFCWLNPVFAVWDSFSLSWWPFTVPVSSLWELFARCFQFGCLFFSNMSICTHIHTRWHVFPLSSADADSSWLTQVDLFPHPAAPVSPCSAPFNALFYNKTLVCGVSHVCTPALAQMLHNNLHLHMQWVTSSSDLQHSAREQLQSQLSKINRPPHALPFKLLGEESSSQC